MKPISRTTVKVNGRGNALVLIVIFAAFAIAYMIANAHIRDKLDELQQDNDLLRAENTTIADELKKLRAVNEDLVRSFPGLSKSDIAVFRKKGLDNPKEDILADLGTREELMPFKGVFGARPSFYRDVRFYLLNSKWAYASYNDGSNIGQTLLEYTVSDRGMISWKVIDMVMSKVSKAGVPSE